MRNKNRQVLIPRFLVLNYIIKYTTIFLIALQFLSCGNVKKATYFNDLGDAQFTETVETLEPVLQKNDILSITVSNLNVEAAEMFDVVNKTSSQGVSFSGKPLPASGYLIDQDGYIQFPFIGAIMAAGLTKKDLRQYITKELIIRKLLLEPIVDIRYLNFKVSVLGEVKNPSVYVIPNEQVTLLEALGLAGDMTIYAKRDNVVLISEQNGIKTTKRINLNTDELFTSPNYYLKSNDIVYVQPNKRKMRSTSTTPQWLGVIIGSLSLMVITIATFR
ncbi:polysaccharide biosynthesis/export family protein [bacterium]|nr:polysaccharide biosynthesis/export family protein [bacterium]